MKKRILSLALAFVMILGLLPAAALAAGEATEVATYEELVAALETDNANILMTADITGTATQNSGYGKAGIVLNAGDVLDGGGYTLTINGANTTWDCAIAMNGGTVKNLTISGAMRGVFMPGANGDVIIDTCVFEDVIYTFNSDAGSKDYSVTIKNTTLNGWTSYSDVHKSVTFERCTFGEGSGYAYCRPYQDTTFTNCEFNEGYEIATNKTADNELAFNDCTYAGEELSAENGSDLFGDSGKVLIDDESVDFTRVAAITKNGVTTKYATLAAAIEAATDGDTITLLWDKGDDPISMAGSVCGNKTVTITGTAEVDWSQGWLFVGRGGEGDGTLIFEDATLTSDETSLANGSYGIHVSAPQKGEDEKNTGKVIFKDSDIQLSYLANRSNVEVDGGELYVHYGFWVGGRPASETPDGTAGTATMDIKNDAVVEVKNHNGMGIGHESKGVLNVDGATFNYTGTEFVIREGGECNVTNATFTATKLTTNKNLFISGDSVVKIEDLNGRATILDDTTLTGSYIKSATNGTTRVLGDLTLNDGFGAAYFMTAGSATSTSGYEGTITIEDGTAVDVSYGVEMNGDLTLNGGTIELSGGNASGGIWGCVFQSGTFEINTDIVVDGGTDTAPIHFTNAAATINSSISQSESGGEPIYIKNSTVTVTEDASVTTDCAVYVNEAGTLESAGDITGTVRANAADAVIKITDGTVEGTISKVDGATVTVTGGAFSVDPTEYLPEGYRAELDAGMYYVGIRPSLEGNMIAEVDNVQYSSLEAAFTAAKSGDEVKILKAGTYTLSTSGKDITITGTVDGVVFDNIGEKNMGGANVTFNNVTFDYYPNGNYTGLQHSGNLTYNNCIINGQVFLYGASETFNNCTFNQNSADAYNVWTYSADAVAFDKCTFNSVGKSVLVYNEAAGPTELTVTNCKFIASAPVEGKAAIEIDTSSPKATTDEARMDGTTITIDDQTTATGFGTGSVSGNSLWNDKKDLTNLTVTVDDEQVWPIAVAQIGDQPYYSLQDAVNAVADNEAVTITLLTDTSEAERISIGSEKDITIVGQANAEGEYPAFTGWFKVTGKLTLKDVTLVAPSTAVPGESISQYTKTVIGLMNTGDVVCDNVTFDMSNAVADSTAITAWWSTGDGANITVTDCTFNCAGQRPIRSDACVTVERCTFNDPYRYAVQMTSKSSTMDEDAEAYVVFNNNTIVDGENGKDYVYGVQLEGDYGCSDLTITGTGNTITAEENDGSTLYFVENTDEMGFETIQWKTESAPVLDKSTFAAKIAGTDGDIYLPTLAEAINAVAAAGTVTLVADSTEEIEVSKALTIELNGFTAEKVTPADGYVVDTSDATKMVFGPVNPATGVILDKTTVSLTVGGTVTLTATVEPADSTDKTVTWTSSDESVATVDNTGKVTAVGEGTATITATVGSHSATCAVTVSVPDVPVTGVTLDRNTASVRVGDTITLTATVTPADATDPSVTWESSDESVATVDENGEVTAVAAGRVTITATAGGKTAACTVTVTRASSGGGSYNPSYTITVEDADNGSIKVSPARASKGQTVTVTVDPDEGYELDELVVLDKNGKEIKLTKKSDSKYTFKMPSGKVTIEASFVEVVIENPFVDVADNAYYTEAVLWAVENGITTGTGDGTTFSPDATCTRAQVVTFLWRAAGCPEPKSAVMPFADVAANSYYYDAVLWAVENGITTGTGDGTTFSPDADCTRGQIVTFLWRSQGSENVIASNPFADVADGSYYADAVIWAVDEAITNGTGDGTTFSPDADCTRGQIVTFLYRCLAE